MLYVLLMAIVCAIAVGQAGAATDQRSSSLGLSMAATCVCLSAPVVFAVVAVWLNRRSSRNVLRFEKRLEWLLRFHGLTWLIAALGTVYWARWPAAIRAHLPAGWVLIDEAIIVAPALASWLISWAVFYAWFSDERPPIGRARFVWNQCRLTLLLAWIPVLTFCAFHDTISAICPTSDGPQTMMIVFLLNLGSLIVFFPRLLGWIWETQPLPAGALRARLLGMAAANGLRIREIHVWQTDRRIANAAVAGVLPSTRRVFLSDALLEQLTEDEIEAAFAHELGHACHHHSLLRLALLLVPVSVYVLSSFVDRWDPWAAGQDVTIPALIAVSGYLIVALGWYSRRLEHEADLWACQQLALRHGEADALQRYVGVLSRLCDRRHLRRGSWLHPGHKSRRSFLITCLSNLKRANAFQREMKWLAAFLVVAALVPLLLLVVT